jgi:hypothetical protein
MQRAYYQDTINQFLKTPKEHILGVLMESNGFDLQSTQRDAWVYQIELLQQQLQGINGKIHFEFHIPRMGKRVDVLLVIDQAIFVVEFKVGESHFSNHAIDQVMDYALDLKNFHETSHEVYIVPILIASKAKERPSFPILQANRPKLLDVQCIAANQVQEVILQTLTFLEDDPINSDHWEGGAYRPTPTIIEAAMALYLNHDVTEITKRIADENDMKTTVECIYQIVDQMQAKKQKAICFVTGVPGAGKTLVGLDVATHYLNKEDESHGVFLSGNGPLVAVMQEALTRSRREQDKAMGIKSTKTSIRANVKSFIQNVHHFRDEYLKDPGAPFEHITIFDEAQRAWNKNQTASFMSRKKGHPDFEYSEPEFLISCMDRREDWAVIICLVGGGQEINTGEGGIAEWIEALQRSFPHWQIFISPHLKDSEYAAGNALALLKDKKQVHYLNQFHLDVSQRSFRAENLSTMVKHLLDLDLAKAQAYYQQVKEAYPVILTRDLTKAKQWLREQATGSERYGLLVSSQAARLRPFAIDIRSPMDPVHWFLDDKDDVRSSYYLEDVATEFQVQGLELDWACVTWDADFRYSTEGWKSFSFVGKKWQNILKEERKMYLKNAYRVLLTRARQGMIIVVPEGDPNDHTRPSAYYDSTYQYLKKVGFKSLD